MVGVGRVTHPQEEAKKQEGYDAQGGSGHCARTKVAIPPAVIMQRFDATPIPICTCTHGTAAVRGMAGRPASYWNGVLPAMSAHGGGTSLTYRVPPPTSVAGG